jgi:tetratricopeptide (TPR) repeat protein
MRASLLLVPFLVVGIGASVAVILSRSAGPPASTSPPPDSTKPLVASSGNPGGAVWSGPSNQVFPDPNSSDPGATVYADSLDFEAEIFATALAHTGHVSDERSLLDWATAIRSRGPRGIQILKREHDAVAAKPAPSRVDLVQIVELRRSIAYLHAYEGDFAEAKAWLERALDAAEATGAADSEVAQLEALIGIIALRRGEVENCIDCVGPSSCIFPLAAGAVHTNPEGSREALEHFTAYLEKRPGDLRVRWLLNLCYMTLGEYPEKVPPRFLVPISSFESPHSAPRFTNITTLVGMVSRGPGSAGGSVFDDFNGDGRPDVFSSSIDVDQGATMLVSAGDGTFEDRSTAAGLDQQVFALNVSGADYDNDGDLDLLLLRGGWENPCRLTLMRNRGDATFEDVTVSAGLDEPIASESASWADYDNDGDLDVFVCGEYRIGSADSRNFCRLYRNEGGGRFTNVAHDAGVENARFAKGCAWGDYDNDGLADLFVSNMSLGHYTPSRLYHNEGDGTFRDVAQELGITGSHYNFSCTFSDQNDDGLLDLFVCDYNVSMAELVAYHLGLPVENDSRLRLYRNLGEAGFRLVSDEAGLGRQLGAMSFNLGDIDNDGDLDIHLGTGWMAYSGLYPDVMLEATETGYADVTAASTTGHLQKGHGVSFADWDHDGDLDFVVVLGGGYPGDRSYRALFDNPGNGRNWLKLRLVGTTSNRSAIGARLELRYTPSNGKARTLYRTVGANNASFGGNSLAESVGLLDAKQLDTLTVRWPKTGATQVFRQIAANQFLEITEGDDAIKPRVLERLTIPAAPAVVSASDQ